MNAIISDCGKYRYRLDREVSLMKTKPILFIGVNPSTADASEDDATIRRMIGFTERWGFSHFMVGNVFAYRSTNVKALAGVDNPCGIHNAPYISAMIDEACMIVPCWGDSKKVPRKLRVHFDIFRTRLSFQAHKVRIFGLTSDGDPLHPLMLSYDTPLKEWREL